MGPPSKRKRTSRENGAKARDTARRIAEENALFLIAENERLLAENQQLSQEIAAANHHIFLLQQAGQRLQIHLEQVAEKADNATLELEELKTNHKLLLNEAIDAKMKSTLYQHAQEKASLKRMIDMFKKQLPTLNHRKPYEKSGSKSTKDSRCATIIKVIENFVGEVNVDDFVTYFVHYISENSAFSFTFGLSPLDSYLLCARWKISCNLIRGLKLFVKNKLGYDFLSAKVHDLRRLYDTKPFYDIRFVTESTSRTVVVELKDLRAMLVKRLEFMYKNGRLKLTEDEQLVVRYLHGKGEADEVTMLVAVIANSLESEKSHGFLLLGYYTGDDDDETLEEKLGKVRKQAEALDSVTYNDTTRAVKGEFGVLDDSDIYSFQSVFHTLKTRNHAAFRDAKLKAEAICQQMYNFNMMLDSGNLENLCE